MDEKELIIWLVRHGETEANVTHKIAGWTNYQLTDKGEEQARAIASFLEKETFDGVWSSDLDRATATARLAYGQTQAITDKRLREMHFGDLDDNSFYDIDPKHRDELLAFSNFNPPGGETFEQLKTRFFEFVDSLSSGKHLIFSHGGAIRSVTISLGEDRFMSNCGIVGINWTKKQVLFVLEKNKHTLENRN